MSQCCLRRFLPRMESFADGSVRQRRRNLGRHVCCIGRPIWPTVCLSLNPGCYCSNIQNHINQLLLLIVLSTSFFPFPPLSFKLRIDILHHPAVLKWTRFYETLITIDPSLFVILHGQKKRKATAAGKHTAERCGKLFLNLCFSPEIERGKWWISFTLEFHYE